MSIYGPCYSGRHQKIIKKTKRFRLPFTKSKRKKEEDEILINHRESLILEHAHFVRPTSQFPAVID